jgi:hypothetical protein
MCDSAKSCLDTASKRNSASCEFQCDLASLSAMKRTFPKRKKGPRNGGLGVIKGKFGDPFFVYIQDMRLSSALEDAQENDPHTIGNNKTKIAIIDP